MAEGSEAHGGVQWPQEESRRATILLLAWPSELGELGCVPSLACLCLEGAKLERL